MGKTTFIMHSNLHDSNYLSADENTTVPNCKTALRTASCVILIDEHKYRALLTGKLDCQSVCSILSHSLSPLISLWLMVA